jgi:hypothetical protein
MDGDKFATEATGGELFLVDDCHVRGPGYGSDAKMNNMKLLKIRTSVGTGATVRSPVFPQASISR